MVDRDALERVAARVRELAGAYAPPDFAHVPDPDAAIFLCAVDHKAGYSRPHRLDGDGPYSGSELMWLCALRAAAGDPGRLSAERLADVTEREVSDIFRVGGETVTYPGRRAALWQDLAAGLVRSYGGSAMELLDACDERLGGPGGLVLRLREFDAYSDPIGKKAFLFGKIAERRGWFAVRDPENWEVSADSVLMRLALRSGLVPPGELDQVRPATRSALRELARVSGLDAPVLDDMLWELGRQDPDLLGDEGGDLREPERDPESAWY